MTTTRSAPEPSTISATESVGPLSAPQPQEVNGRRLSSTLGRTGTRHSDRAGRRLSTTSSNDHATVHSWHGSPGIHANLPTPGLLSSLAGAAHYTGNPRYSQQEAVRANFGLKEVVLVGQRKQIVDDVLELFSAHPSLEIFDRSWNRGAVFEDPWTRSVGYNEYAARWFSLPKLVTQSTTVEHRVLSSTNYPHRIVFEQTRQYTLCYIKSKKTIRSLVIIELGGDDKIIKMEDKWDGEELPCKWGAAGIRRFNGKAMPLFFRVPQRPTTPG
ncbi:hypothetical protein CTheo_3963 [Ceratobasidium theobromae]|uniref:Uncharacterized protein n=1 Tax=Ceratobasidium theobromae TaxID=1582974 RepID=A0A5N5QLY2_9AGAM|nr:hypothetical protein CTheo_3963 [Ceratobasidium theobromae]